MLQNNEKKTLQYFRPEFTQLKKIANFTLPTLATERPLFFPFFLHLHIMVFLICYDGSKKTCIS